MKTARFEAFWALSSYLDEGNLYEEVGPVMTYDAGIEETLKLYLLGQLDEERQSRLEERLLLEEEYSDEITAAEDALTDEYVRGNLSAADRKSFQQHFLGAPERAEKLRLSRSLNRYISEERATVSVAVREKKKAGALESLFGFLGFQRPVVAMAMMAATLVFAAVGGWLVVQTINLNGQIQQAKSEQASLEQQNRLERAQREGRGEDLARQLQQEQATRSELEKELERLKQQRSSTPALAESMVSISLLPGLLRDSGELKSLALGSGTTSVRLRLALDAAQGQDFKGTFSGAIQDSEGKQVWKGSKLSAAGKAVSVTVPATVFKEGEYRLVLDAQTGEGSADRAGTYYFRVTKSKK
jgi:hypothetical protein